MAGRVSGQTGEPLGKAVINCYMCGFWCFEYVAPG